MHSLVKPLSFLIGKWNGKNGIGKYPTISDFVYNETLEITHPAPNQPCLHLRFSSWFENPDTKEKTSAHFEMGFLKIKPNSDPIYVTYTSAHNNGLTIVEEGNFDATQNMLSIESNNIGRTSINKPPAVIKLLVTPFPILRV